MSAVRQRTGVRLAAFGVAALLAFGAGAAVGRAVGPIESPDPAPRHAPAGHEPAPTPTTVAHGGHPGMSR